MKSLPILRHPNVLTEQERLALPDPCRPIDEPVMTNSVTLTDTGVFSEISQILFDTSSAYQVTQLSIRLANFIEAEQALNQISKGKKWRLPLSILAKLIQYTFHEVWQKIISQYPDCTLLQQAIERGDLTKQVLDNILQNDPINLTNSNVPMQSRLFFMEQIKPIMLCVFLLSQCKTRKTINPQITLQDLVVAINRYVQEHQQSLLFTLQYQDFHINLAQIECALLVMDWQISKQDNLADRCTNISSQTPFNFHENHE